MRSKRTAKKDLLIRSSRFQPVFTLRGQVQSFSNLMCFVFVDEVDLAEFDNFDDNHFAYTNSEGQVNGATSDSSSDSLTEKSMKKAPPPRPRDPPFIIKTRTLSIGSLPDMHVGEGELSEIAEDSLGVTPNELTHSSPQIYQEDSINSDTQNAALKLNDDNNKDISCQTHHSTAPDLKALEVNGVVPRPHSPSQMQTSNMRISFSDDGIKNYAVDLPDTGGATSGQRASALSRIKSGLSQVSHLIVNPNSSPHTRRRKQILEAQLLDNTMKSKLRFKNCQTKILLL